MAASHRPPLKTRGADLRLTFARYNPGSGGPMNVMPAGTRLYTVFEAIDEDRREIYVGMSPEASLGSLDPSQARVRPIESRMEESDARDFIRLYVKTELPPGWRFRT